MHSKKIWTCSSQEHKIYQDHESLCKSKIRKSSTFEKNKKDFVESMQILFDIAHQDAEKLIKFEECKAFLKDQPEARVMTIENVCQEIEGRKVCLKMRKYVIEGRNQRECARKEQASGSYELYSSWIDTLIVEEEENNEEFIGISKYYKNEITELMSTEFELLDTCSPAKKPRIVQQNNKFTKCIIYFEPNKLI